MVLKQNRVSSGVSHLDRLLGGLFIGDNVVWYDAAGSLAWAFCMNFIQTSQSQNRPMIYVSFDRSPKNLLEKLGSLAESPHLTILDCFTCGKGDGSEVFNKFYEKDGAQWPYQIIKVTDPRNPDQVVEAIYSIHGAMQGDVRFVFESLTGMEDLWGGEDQILKFYSHSCPRLYELNTIAYWIIEKDAHSDRLKAHINQIAQVAIELSLQRGKSMLSIIKADKRSPETINTPQIFRSDGMHIRFEGDRRLHHQIDLGRRLKDLRSKQGLSQTELARLVGVTPSTISQIESNLIHPSLSALYRIAEILSIEVASFFQEQTERRHRIIFSSDSGVEVSFKGQGKARLLGPRLTPPDFEPEAEPYLIEIPENKSLTSHFFFHKGEEMGYVISGNVWLEVDRAIHKAGPGDIIYLTSEIPSQWQNPGPGDARILWIKIR